MKEITEESRYKIALEVLNQYKFYGYDEEMPFEDWLKRAIVISKR